MTVSFPFKILTGVDNIIIMRLKLTAENYVQYTGTVYLLGYDIPYVLATIITYGRNNNVLSRSRTSETFYPLTMTLTATLRTAYRASSSSHEKAKKRPTYLHTVR